MRRLKKLAIVSSMALMLGAGLAPAQAQTAPAPRAVAPLWGNISAFEGKTSPFWGNIAAFGGSVNPFWGNISAFWGNISAFGGDLNPYAGDVGAFWGNIEAFNGGVHPEWGNISAFWGNIEAFDGSVGPLWGNIAAFWGNIEAFQGDQVAWTGLQTNFGQLITKSETTWGASVTAATGQTFKAAFVDPLMAKYGLNLNDPASFAKLSTIDRTHFFFDWHDQLMQYSGRDQVDWWMGAVRWSPSLTQSLKPTNQSVIGIIDFTFRDTDLVDNTTSWAWKGYDNPMGGHGGAVASLLVSAHDGKGVMGIAPNSSVAAFNPFDSTGTASWDDVANGISVVSLMGARVVNLSLGVPGWTLAPEFNDLYSRPLVAMLSKQTVFVQAAGNDGLAQTKSIEWNFTANPQILIVGSVGPTGVISPFSNTPGQACLLDKGVCKAGNRLMDRFLVAPGEWILTSDNKGGVTRYSGTSFAAPMVTGAVALLQDRWEWLRTFPTETADVILSSARDLGAPGVDPVYGHGLLDIAASQAPLDLSKLYQSTSGSKQYLVLANGTKLNGAVTPGPATLTAMEDIGATYRDFQVPLTAILKDVGATTAKTSTQTVATATTTKGSKKALALVSDAPLPNPLGWDMQVSVFDTSLNEARPGQFALPDAEFVVSGRSGMTLKFGSGVGAMSLSGDRQAPIASHDPLTGGANPILGLASGGGFVAAELPVLGNARLSFGSTTRRHEDVYADPNSGEVLAYRQAAQAYTATAGDVKLTQPVGRDLELSVGYSYLSESKGVLGLQSTSPLAFAQGAQTDAATLGVRWAASSRITLTGSATVGHTRGQAADTQMLAVHGDGILTTAYEAALNLDGVFGRTDSVRLALVQPLHVERGGFDLSESEVIDRTTGERGQVTRFTPVDGQSRKLALEASYSLPVLGGAGDLAAFVRAEAATASGSRAQTEQMVGGSLSIRY